MSGVDSIHNYVVFSFPTLFNFRKYYTYLYLDFSKILYPESGHSWLELWGLFIAAILYIGN